MELDPLFLDGLTNAFSGQAARQAFASLQAGVMGAGDLKVTPGAGQRELVAAAGIGLVQGNNVGVLAQGLYQALNDAAKSSTLWEAGGPGAAALNPRLDQIVGRVWDSQADGGSGLRKWRLAVIPGAETNGVTLDNRSGVAMLPPNCLLLADVITRPGMTVYPAVDIRDRRPWARGFFRVVGRSGAVIQTASTALAPIDSATYKTRIEVPDATHFFRVQFDFGFGWGGAALGAEPAYDLWVDGGGLGQPRNQHLDSAGGNRGFDGTWLVGLSQGSHTRAGAS